MKKLKIVGQCFIALILAFFVVAGTVQSAHAVDLSFAESFWSIQDWDDAKMYITNYWRTSYNFNNGILLSRDELDDLCVSLNEAGFPCAVVTQSDPSGMLVYYILGNGAVPVETAWGNTHSLDISGYVHTNMKGAVYYSRYVNNVSAWLNRISIYLDHIDNALTAEGGLFELWFSLFNERMKYIGTGIDLINANLEDLTITGDVTIDTTPITDRLDKIADRLIADDIPIDNAVNRIRLIMLDIPGYIDGIESTLTTISSRLNTQNGYVDGVEGLLSNVVTAVNGIDLDTVPVVQAINTKGDAIVTAVNDVEGWMDDLQTTMVNNSVDALNQQLDVKDELIQFMESTAADRDVLLGTIVDKMDDMGFSLDVDSLNIEGISFDTSPITDAIENYHADFNEYFAQFGENIDYGEKQLSFSGTQEYYWDSDNQSYLSGTLTDGSSVTVYRVPDVTDGLSGVTSGYPRVVDRDGLPMILPTTSDRFPGMLNFIYDGVRQQISFDGVYGGGYASGQSFVVDDAAAGSSIYRVEFYGKTTQAGVPSPSSPISLENVRSYEYYDGYVVGLDIEDRDGRQSNTVFAPAPSYGLRGIPVNSGGNYTDENGQQWLCDVVDSEFGLHIQRVGAITFDGSDDENWRSYTWGQTGYYIVVPGMSLDFVKLAQCGALSTHFPYSHMINQASSGIGFKLSNTSGENVAPVFCCSELFPDLASFKTWLQSNPVTVYYPLAEPVYTELSYPTDFDENYRSGEAYEPQTHFDADCPVTVYYKAVDPVTSLYADADGDWHYGYKSGTSARVDRAAALSVLRDAFNVRTYTDADSVMFNEGKNHITVTNDGQFDITVLQGNKIIMWYVNWAHSSRSFLDGKLTSLESTLSKLDSGGTDIDIENNTDINITEDNDSYNVFYVTDPETGEDTSIIDLSSDTLTIFGKLLNFLYQVGFKDALDGAGGSIGDLSDFYMDTGEGSVDVWAS